MPFEGLTPGQGIEEPTAIRFAPNGLVFVAEKSGKILIYNGVADKSPTLFADLRTEVYNANDRGLLGLALDPNFSAAHPYLYVLYAYDHQLGEEAPPPRWGNPEEDGDGCPEPPGANTNGCVISGRLSRLTADLTTDRSIAEEPLITDWCQQFSSHSVGDLQFDSEGNLWASGGDGASFENADYGQFGFPQKNPCDDPPVGIGGEEEPPGAEGGALRAQNPEKLNGSLIRVDPETGQGVAGNPLAASLNANERRLVGKGFRNPFRFAIDPASGEVYVDNVGSSVYEEIDRFTPSSSSLYNSGWPCYEGPEPRALYAGLGLNVCKALYASPATVSQPFFYYSHEAGVTPEDPCPYKPGSAISGLAFYGGGSYPIKYDGALFFADAVRECIYVMRTDDDGQLDPSTVEPFLTEGGLYPGVDIEAGPEGDLYYASLYGPGFTPGAIHRISYDENAPDARLKANGPVFGAVPLQVEFDASESTDPQNEELEYRWDLDGNGSFAPPTTDSTKTETYETAENRTAAVEVIDQSGHGSVAQLPVYPGDTPPVPDIEAPDESLEWRVGQSIHFTGHAQDGEDGSLDNAHLYWRSRLLHCPGGPSSCHSHPLQVFPAVASGDLIAPSHDFPSYIELTLTATDSRGLSASKTVKLSPHPVELTFASNPPGITLTAGPLTQPAPFTLPAIEDSRVTISAPSTATLGGVTYTWSRWSDGGARAHTVAAGGSGSYVAIYTGGGGGQSSEPPPRRPKTAVTLERHPPKHTHSRRARFVFSGAGAGGFKCRIDKDRLRPCRSPKVYKHLELGGHEFAVIAVSVDGNPKGKPAKFSWKVLPKR